MKLDHKLYRNRLPPYFNNFLPEFGEHNHMLRNNLIRLPVVRCQFGEMNAKYQMHLRLRNLATPGYICNLNDVHANSNEAIGHIVSTH